MYEDSPASVHGPGKVGVQWAHSRSFHNTDRLMLNKQTPIRTRLKEYLNLLLPKTPET